MSIGRNEKRHQYTRGAEVMRHEFSMYFSSLYTSFMISVMTALGTSVFVANALLEPNEGEILLGRMVAEYNVSAGDAKSEVSLDLERGGRTKHYEMPSDMLLAVTAPEWRTIKTKLWMGLAFSICCGVGLFFVVNWAWRSFGRKVAVDEVVRGTEMADPKEVAASMRKAGTASSVTLAGVPLERGKETLNTMVSGAIGTGKSVAISEALEAIRRAGQKAIIYDPTGEYIQRFYREGQDVILNPFDQRSPAWKPWNEVRQPYDYANISESFIPVTNDKEPFWQEGAQAVLEDILTRLAKQNQPTNRRIVEVVNILTLKEVQEIVKGLPGAVYMDPEAGKTALGIRMNVVRAAKALRYMGDGPAERQFSIRNWISDPNPDSWLFLSAREDMLTAVRPLITAWFDTALRAVMTLQPDRERLIWAVIDELPSLQKIGSLLEATTRARKYGLASILGYQNVAQVQEDYGVRAAQTIISMCQNKLTLRVPDFQTAEYIAKDLGSQEILEHDENISFGSDSNRDGVTITTRRADKVLVTTSQIQGLPDLEGFLRLAGTNEIMRVKFKHKDYPAIAEPFVMKDVISYALDE
jgi:type IV conjugative transfer system coupling protein TraD